MPTSNVSIKMNQTTPKRKHLRKILWRATKTTFGQYRKISFDAVTCGQMDTMKLIGGLWNAPKRGCDSGSVLITLCSLLNVTILYFTSVLGSFDRLYQKFFLSAVTKNKFTLNSTGSVIIWCPLNLCCLTMYFYVSKCSILKLAVMGMHRSLAKQDKFPEMFIRNHVMFPKRFWLLL
jgi:hypothetical protein